MQGDCLSLCRTTHGCGPLSPKSNGWPNNLIIRFFLRLVCLHAIWASPTDKVIFPHVG